MITSQLLKYNVHVIKRLLKRECFKIHIYYLKYKFNWYHASLQNTDVEDGGEILNLESDYWSTNPVRFWYLCEVMTLVLGWNEITQVSSALVLPKPWNIHNALKLGLYNHHDHSINLTNFDCQFGWYTPTQHEYFNDQ